MKHFLISRFAYPEDYPHLAERIELFNKLTRPSVEAQTCKDFEWLILGRPPMELTATFFDAPQHIGLRGESARDDYMAYIKARTVGEDLVLMTRLDNDDMLMPTFIEDAQKAAREPGLYEFLGYRLDLRTGLFYEDTLHHEELTSPFLTLAQDPQRLKSVYWINHSKMWKYFTLTTIAKRNWVQVIHDTNQLLNRQTVKVVGSRGRKVEPPECVRRLLVP